MADTSGPLWPLQHVASSVKLPGNLKIQAPCARRLHRCFRGHDWSRNLRAVPAGKVSFRRLDLLRLSIFVGPIWILRWLTVAIHIADGMKDL